jgi:hypothetical protein
MVVITTPPVTPWHSPARVKAACVHGGTDEHGIKAVEGGILTSDLHATLLALMGWITSACAIGMQVVISDSRMWRGKFCVASN